MKIVHVAEFASGGVATYLRNVIAFQLNSDQVDSVVLLNAKGKSEDFNFSSPKFSHQTYEYTRSISGMMSLLRLRKQIDKLEPDVVHFHSSFAGIVRLTYFLKSSSYKIVYCAHGWSFIQKNRNKFENKIFELVERVEAVKTDLIVNISKSEERIAEEHKLPVKKMKVIYNSIPEHVSLSEVKNPFHCNGRKKILFVGRFDKAKGLDFLLQNARLDENNLELVIIGESVLNDTKSKVDQRRGVTFLGWIDNEKISSYIDLCDAVIVPSLWEGFGLVALEAMRRHKMVLCSDAGGLPELIKDGQNGLVFRTGSAKELNLVLEKFSGMKQSVIESMGNRGFQTFQRKYDYEDLGERLLRCYGEFYLN